MKALALLVLKLAAVLHLAASFTAHNHQFRAIATASRSNTALNVVAPNPPADKSKKTKKLFDPFRTIVSRSNTALNVVAPNPPADNKTKKLFDPFNAWQTISFQEILSPPTVDLVTVL